MGEKVARPEQNGENAPAPPDPLQAWDAEPPLRDESMFTPWCERGWHSWNEMSPELEFCDLAATLVRLVKPELVIETGVGQGYITRRVAAQLEQRQRLLCHESDGGWRELLRGLNFFKNGHVTLSEEPSPSKEDFRRAQVTIIDSDSSVRAEEVRAWASSARAGAMVLVHDCGNGHPPGTRHAKLAALIKELKIPGVFLRNPRGSFLGVGGALQARLDEALRAATRAEDELRALKASRSWRYTSFARRARSGAVRRAQFSWLPRGRGKRSGPP